jgi:hypothetical protein
MAAVLPATMPSSSAGQWRRISARCSKIGTAKATVAGPSSSTNQWVPRM